MLKMEIYPKILRKNKSKSKAGTTNNSFSKKACQYFVVKYLLKRKHTTKAPLFFLVIKTIARSLSLTLNSLTQLTKELCFLLFSYSANAFDSFFFYCSCEQNFEVSSFFLQTHFFQY